jgi:sugar phosphate isomerase/epimerase
MTRRQLLSTLAAKAAALAAFRERAGAAPGPNIRWAVSMFLWTSTQWPDRAPVPFTDMLDVIKDVGFDGFRFVGWPEALEKYDLTLPFLDRELSRRNLRIATLSFHGEAHDVSKHAAIDKAAHGACEFLKHFGATEMVVFSPRRPNKVLVREYLRVACEYYNHLGDLCAPYGIRAGLHNHSQGQLVESQDEVELMLKLTDPKRFHWAPDTVHLYMAGCNIPELFAKYADRLICMDFIDGKYEFQRQEMRLANGKTEPPGSQNGTFMLSNRDLGDGEIDFPRLTRELKRVAYKGWIIVDDHYTPLGPRADFTRSMKYIREKIAPIYA